MLLHYYHSDAKNKNIIVYPRSHTFMKFKIMYHLNHLIYTTQNSLKNSRPAFPNTKPDMAIYLISTKFRLADARAEESG